MTTVRKTSRIISEAEAQGQFSDLLRRVGETGEAVVIERDDEPDVALVPARGVASRGDREDTQTLDADVDVIDEADDWLMEVDTVRARIRVELAGRPFPNAVELIQQMREARDAQLIDNYTEYLRRRESGCGAGLGSDG